MSEAMEFSNYVPNVHFELIPIKMLVSNQTYQRPISSAHVGRTALNFNIYQINPVKVSRRDGTNYVFDGQHTIETVAIASGSRETPVWCMIYDDLAYEQEADIFANQKKHTRPLKSIEIFNANIEAENDIQMTIKSLVENYNLTISTRKIPGHITAVSALEYIFTKYGYHVLDRTLLLVVSTWEGEVESLGANILKGIAKLVVAYGENLNDEQFVERLSKVSVREIIRTARDRHAGTQGYAEAMLLQYNKRLKYPLKWASLQSNTDQFAASSVDSQCNDLQFSIENGYLINSEIEEIAENEDTDFDDYEYEEIPDHEDALQTQVLMDDLGLRSNSWLPTLI